MVSVLKRIARQLERIAEEVENMEKISSLGVLRRIRLNLEDIEEDIDEGMNSKVAQMHTDYLLSRYFRDSESALALIKHAIEENTNQLKSEDRVEQINESIKIRNIVLRIIKKLDDYYKNHLNPKFNYHGISHAILNDRLNELKKVKKDFDNSINKLQSK